MMTGASQYTNNNKENKPRDVNVPTTHESHMFCFLDSVELILKKDKRIW